MNRLGWIFAVVFGCGFSLYTYNLANSRYEALHSGWSWDVAFFNQSFWAMSRGDGVLTVRPSASFADEGPSVWKMNHLSPLRIALLPIYAAVPGPRTLLALQAALFWLVIPASYSLVRSESGSGRLAISASLLVPMTPLLGPLAVNDFRELQIAMPFVLWAIEGVRGRRVGLAAIGIGGMLAARQEFALVVATLPLLSPRNPEDPGRTLRWSWVMFFLGLAWMLWVYFGYLQYTAGHAAPESYLAQFEGPKAAIDQTLRTASEFLILGLGSWALLMLIAPRAALLVVPWVWNLSSGRWALGFLSTEEWHHVRYTAPMVALGLAAGLIGYSRLFGRISRRRGSRWLLIVAWAVIAAGLLIPRYVLDRRLAAVPVAISAAEARSIWAWIDRVGPDDGVVCAYEVSAPLSSRRLLYANRLDQNKPKGYPARLDPAIRWMFIRVGDVAPEILLRQGFRRVYDGPFLVIYRR